MMLPFLPDLGHGAALASTAGIALLGIGLGSLGGARTAETALIAGWGMAGLATIVVGTLTPLSLRPVMMLAALLGGGGLLRIVWQAWAGRPVLAVAGFTRLLLLSLPLWVVIAPLDPAGWDDFSHWLLNARYLTAFDRFPTLAQGPFGSAHAGYPYGMALPTYGVFLLTGQWSASIGIYWSGIVLLAACRAVAIVLEERYTATGAAGTLVPSPRLAWGCAGLALLAGVMLGPTFTPKWSLSNTADGTTAAVLAMLCATLREVLTGRHRSGWTQPAVLGWVGIAFVNLRQTNLVMLALTGGGFALGMLCWRRGRALAGLTRIAAPLFSAVAAWALWNRYALREIPDGQFTFLPPASWHWHLIGPILGAVAQAMLVKGGFFILAAGLGWQALRAARQPNEAVRAQAVLPLAVCVIVAGNVAFLSFTYVTAFSAADAQAATSFWRYSEQSGPALLLALAQLAPAAALRPRLASRGYVIAGCAAIAPWIAPGFLRYDLRFASAGLIAQADRIAREWNAQTPLQLVDLRGNDFEPVVIAYRLHERALGQGRTRLPIDIIWTPDGLTPSAAERDRLLAAPLIWLAAGSAPLARTGLPLTEAYSYLLGRDAAGLHLLQAWPRREKGSLRSCRPVPARSIDSVATLAVAADRAMINLRSRLPARRAALSILAGIAIGAGATMLAMGPQVHRRPTVPALVREATALWRGAAAPPVARAVIQCWGDSLTAGTGATPGHDIPALIAYLFHRPMLNGGLPGATSARIAARMLARSPSPIPENVIIWVGRNDDPTDPDTTLHNIAAMIGSLPPGSRFLVLGILNADGRPERRGGDRYALLAALNQRLAVQYGEHFLSLQDTLIAQAVPVDGDDRDAIAADVVPPSLRADALHLNDKGNALAAYAIEAALERGGWD